MKKCSKCGETNPDKFSPAQKYRCRSCAKEYNKEYSLKNADKRKEYNLKNADKIKEYNLKNADKRKEYNKEYNLKNADKIKEYYLKNADKRKEYYLKNADKIKEYHKEYNLKNADKKKEYYLKNADKMKEYNKEYRKNNQMVNTNPNFKTRSQTKLSIHHPHYEIIEYMGYSRYSIIRCNNHDTTFEAIIPLLLKSKLDGHKTSHCPQCVIEAKTSTYVKLIAVKNPAVKLVGQLKYDKNTKQPHQCGTCQYIWDVRPACVQKGSGCPICSNKLNNYDSYKNQRTTLYYLEVGGQYKIGLTKTNITRRYYKEIRDGITITPIREWVFEDGVQAYKLEQKILKEFSNKKYKGSDLLYDGNSELFSENILNEIEPMITLTLLEAE